MLSRRELLGGGLAALALRAPLLGAAAVGGGLGGLGGCARSKARITWPRRTRHEGVEFIELFPSDADESSPLVVAVHGMGDRPEHWIESWRSFPAKVQIALPRAFTRHGDGFSWFELRDGMSDDELGAEVSASEAKLWKGVASLAGARRILVTGFSQGGILSFAMASRHADRVAKAFPVSGSCPGPILPKNNARTAPLVAFHGTHDQVLAFKWGKAAVDAFRQQGNDAVLREYPGVGHTITSEMRADLWAELARAIPLT